MWSVFGLRIFSVQLLRSPKHKELFSSPPDLHSELAEVNTHIITDVFQQQKHTELSGSCTSGNYDVKASDRRSYQ